MRKILGWVLAAGFVLLAAQPAAVANNITKTENISDSEITERLNLNQTLKKSKHDIGKSIGDFFKAIGEGIGILGKGIAGFFSAAGDLIGKGLIAIGSAMLIFISVAGEFFGKLGTHLAVLGSVLGSAIGNGIAVLSGMIGLALSTIGSAISTILSSLISFIWKLKPDNLTDAQYTAIVVGSVCGPCASAGIWYWIKRLAPGGALLYTRIPENRILENATRRRIFNMIQKNPGINMSALSKELGISWGATVHHLRKLEKTNRVHVEEINHERCFFENGGRLSHDMMEISAALKDGTARTVFECIKNNPGISQKGICQKLDLKPPLVSWHVKRLNQDRLIERRRNGKSFELSVADRFSSIRMREIPAA